MWTAASCSRAECGRGRAAFGARVVGEWDAVALASPAAPPAAAAAPSFASDAALLEDALRSALSPAQLEAFRAREFDYARMALREGRFDLSRASMSLLLAQLNGRVKTTTQRRLSSVAGGLCLNGLLAGGDARGRASDLFCAVRVADGAVGVVKVY